MTEAEQIMKRCQAGTRNYEEANNLHAACYGIIGKLLAQEQEPVAWHEIVLNQKQFLDKMEWLLAKTAAPPRPEQDSTCSITLRLQGKPYPRTCKKCGLGPCIAQPTAQPEQEPIYQYQMANGSWIDQTKESHDYNVRHGQATVRVVHTAPPQRPRVVFPTMLRKMWSGSEVQAWLDENVNKEKNT